MHGTPQCDDPFLPPGPHPQFTHMLLKEERSQPTLGKIVQCVFILKNFITKWNLHREELLQRLAEPQRTGRTIRAQVLHVLL